MILDVKQLCSLVFKEDLRGEQACFLPKAPIVIVVISTGKVAIDSTEMPRILSAGSLLIAKGEVHISPLENCHVLAVGIQGTVANMVDMEDAISADCTACPMAAQLLRDITSTNKEYDVNKLCYELLCEIATADEQHTALPPLVTQAVLAIRENFANLYGVEELSNQLGVSKSHLVRVFSSAMGVAPGKYLMKIRINEAKRLLAQREYSLEVIATLCGFAGANYFCKVFKKETGQTAGEYRNLSSAQNIKGSNIMEDILYL